MKLPAPLRRLLRRGPRVHVVRLAGVISRGSGLSDEATSGPIEAAFSGRPVAVALLVNSPGGAPVQSALIAARIRRLADKRKVPVIAFCEDVAASGGYWIACAADEIFADASSLVGSVGVISAGFGAHELIARAGIERRVQTTGPRKMILDPFQPQKAEDLADLAVIQTDILEAFAAHVRTRRAGRLRDDAAVFSGAVWAGARAREVGLIDGLGHVAPVMTERFGDAVTFRVFGPRRPLLARLGVPRVAGEAAGTALETLEARLHWGRFGL